MPQPHKQDVFKNAMHWKEGSQNVFHADAYNFGISLKPLLKDESTVDDLVRMMKSYEKYRSRHFRVMRPLYTNRYLYIKQLLEKDDQQYLQLFNNSDKVRRLARKQMEAHILGMKAEPGWQQAMKNAGIWDDDKVEGQWS